MGHFKLILCKLSLLLCAVEASMLKSACTIKDLIVGWIIDYILYLVISQVLFILISTYFVTS